MHEKWLSNPKLLPAPVLVIDANVDLEEFPDAYSKYDQAIFQYFDISDRMNNVTIGISNGFDFCDY